MRPKIPELEKAMLGRFDEPHGFLARMPLDHIDQLIEMERRLDEKVDTLMAPFVEAAMRLATIPGVGCRTPR
jgi:transposase